LSRYLAPLRLARVIRTSLNRQEGGGTRIDTLDFFALFVYTLGKEVVHTMHIPKTFLSAGFWTIIYYITAAAAAAATPRPSLKQQQKQKGGTKFHSVQHGKHSLSPKQPQQQQQQQQQQPSSQKRGGGGGFLDKLFDSADTNHNGSISNDELYILVLKLYIHLNRHRARIDPPSRETVYRIFVQADQNHNRRISRDEFTGLARIFTRRAIPRIVAHKLVTVVGAPLLAESIVHYWSAGVLSHVATHCVTWVLPPSWQCTVLPILTNRQVWRTLLLITFIISLGNKVVGAVTWVLDLNLPELPSNYKKKKKKKK
jgi:EF-hand domain pair